MIEKTAATFWVKIFGSGPLHVVEQVCRKNCFEKGLCVTVEPMKFIYTGGEEQGYVVGLINYPRFPTSNFQEIEERAKELAFQLLDATYQHSVLVMTPITSYWYTKREERE